MSNNLTAITSDLMSVATLTSEDGTVIRRTCLALEQLMEIIQQVAPPGTDSRLDAWRDQYLNNKQLEECPSDLEPDHHISHI